MVQTIDYNTTLYDFNRVAATCSTNGLRFGTSTRRSGDSGAATYGSRRDSDSNGSLPLVMSNSIVVVKGNSPNHDDILPVFGTAQKVFGKLALLHFTEQANTWADMY